MSGKTWGGRAEDGRRLVRDKCDAEPCVVVAYAIPMSVIRAGAAVTPDWAKPLDVMFPKELSGYIIKTSGNREGERWEGVMGFLVIPNRKDTSQKVREHLKAAGYVIPPDSAWTTADGAMRNVNVFMTFKPGNVVADLLIRDELGELWMSISGDRRAA